MKKYTVDELAKISGVTTRTLRHYHQIGLLLPEGKNSSGVRIYTVHHLDKLQQILLHKSCGFDLKTIKIILSDPKFDVLKALKNQKKIIIAERKRQRELLNTIKITIKNYLGEKNMTDSQKFKGLKEKMIADNYKKYGTEVKSRWGADAWKKSNQLLRNMTQEQFENAQNIEKDFKKTLNEAFSTHNPAGELAQKSVELHKQWLTAFWPQYSKDAHLGLATMYVEDVRFHHYFNDQKDLAEFFREAVSVYAKS